MCRTWSICQTVFYCEYQCNQLKNQINFARKHQHHQKINQIKSLKHNSHKEFERAIDENHAQTFDQRKFNSWRVSSSRTVESLRDWWNLFLTGEPQCRNSVSTGLQFQDFNHWDVRLLPQQYMRNCLLKSNSNNNNHPKYSSHLRIQALAAHPPRALHIHRQLLLHLAQDPKSASLPHQIQLSQILPVHWHLALHGLPTSLLWGISNSAQKSTTKTYIQEHLNLAMNNSGNNIPRQVPQFEKQLQK